MSRCECKGAGFCSRHNVPKTEHLVELCRSSPRYFAIWEEGRGPLQRKAPDYQERRNRAARRKIRGSKYGPGSELADAIKRLGYTIERGCKCKSRVAAMNAWGPDGCRERTEEIVDWLMRSAKKAGWLERFVATAPVLRWGTREVLRQLVKEACDRSESKILFTPGLALELGYMIESDGHGRQKLRRDATSS